MILVEENDTFVGVRYQPNFGWRKDLNANGIPTDFRNATWGMDKTDVNSI